ncbi:MAG: aldehyde dehydrogenase family protein [bacterium]|nr:aldehyde dehydrogenase family protein [bacterium]MCP5067937.1 aldehyde dehydrogenase family protein [bacterium]
MREAPHTDLAEIPDAVARLRSAYDSGRTRPLAWRRQQLEGIKAMCTDRAEEFVEALRADFGKPPLEAIAMDVYQGKTEAAGALRNLKKWTRPQRIGPIPLIGRSFVLREPLGVALIISPWNYPIGLLLSPLVGAIAAGNAVMLKPSEVTPHTSAALARFIPDYLDPEAIALVEGGVPETTALLEEHFDHIFYTGNGHVGRVVMEAAAKNLTPVTLELGGKSPCLVDREVDIATTAQRIAWGKFVNAGQTCIAPDYVLVHRDREEELVGALEAVTRGFYGEDPKAAPDYARVVNGRHCERLAKLLESGSPAFGGEVDAEQNYIAPTVLRNVDLDSPIMQEEIFGPILPVLAVEDMDEAIRIVNTRDKPLALYVFTENEAVYEKVLRETSSGGACVNGTLMHIMDARAPFGGVGPSGQGAYHGRYSFETFSHRKTVLKRGFRMDLKFLYPPYSDRKRRIAQRFM